MQVEFVDVRKRYDRKKDSQEREVIPGPSDANK